MLSDQEKKELKQQIKSNQHEVFVVSVEEMDAIMQPSPKGNLPHIKNAWQKLKGKAETGASYYASADDLRTLSKLVGDLGGFATKVYVKTLSKCVTVIIFALFAICALLAFGYYAYDVSISLTLRAMMISGV